MSDVTQLEITGTLPTTTTGGFKYRYTNLGDNAPLGGTDRNQALPNSVTTIKIVLKKNSGR